MDTNLNPQPNTPTMPNLNNMSIDSLQSQPEPKKMRGLDPEQVLRLKNTLVNFIIPLICFSSSLLLIALVLYPTYNILPALRQELAANTDKRDQLNTKLEKLKKIVAFKATVDEDSALVNTILSTEPAEPKLLDQVNQIAVNSGLKVLRLAYSGSSKENNVNVSLGAEGNLDQLTLFTESIESAARVVLLDSFRYTQGTDADKNSVLSVSITINAPYLFVQSTAVTDDPIDIDLSSEAFNNLIAKIKAFKVYDFSSLPLPPQEVPAAPAAEGTTSAAPAPTVQGAKSVRKDVVQKKSVTSKK